MRTISQIVVTFSEKLNFKERVQRNVRAHTFLFGVYKCFFFENSGRRMFSLNYHKVRSFNTCRLETNGGLLYIAYEGDF